MRERYAYILRRVDPDTHMPAYKIGISYDPHRRASQCKATLLAYGPGGTSVERELHNHFAHLRFTFPQLAGSTEWFVDDDGSIAEYLKSLEYVRV